LVNSLKAENAKLREGLNSLSNEVQGTLGIEGDAIRELIGNTNYGCLEYRLKLARQILEEIDNADT
jgi:hypothetical protein